MGTVDWDWDTSTISYYSCNAVTTASSLYLVYDTGSNCTTISDCGYFSLSYEDIEGLPELYGPPEPPKKLVKPTRKLLDGQPAYAYETENPVNRLFKAWAAKPKAAVNSSQRKLLCGVGA